MPTASPARRWIVLGLVALAVCIAIFLRPRNGSNGPTDHGGTSAEVRALQIRGKAFFEDQRYADAQRTLERALALDPGNVVTLRALGAAYLKGTFDFKRARELFARALEIEPDSAAAEFGLGTVLSLLQEYDEALVHLRRAHELAPQDPDVAYYFAKALDDTGAIDAAVAAYEYVLSLDAEDGSAMYRIQQLLRQSDPARSAQYLARFSALEGLRGSAARRSTGQEWSELLTLGVSGGATDGFRAPPAALSFEPVDLEPRGATALACGDVDGDCDPDVFAAGAGLLLNTGDGFEDGTGAAGLTDAAKLPATQALLLDFDNDRAVDLLLVAPTGLALYVNDGKGAFHDATAAAKLSGVRARRVIAFDSDHEGDLDLLLIGTPEDGSELTLLRNDLPPVADNSREPPSRAVSFSRVGPECGIVGAAPGGDVTFGDFENGNDTDVLLLGPDAPGALYSNLRGNRFRDVGTACDAAKLRARAFRVADLDADGWLDVVMLRPDLHLSIARNRGDGTFADARDAGTAPPGSERIELVDPDADGDLDVLVLGSETCAMFENQHGEFADVSEAWLGPGGAKGARAATAVDFDGDGAQDVVVLHADGSLALLRNGLEGAVSITVRLEGFKSNALATGCKIEARRGDFYLKRETHGTAEFLGLAGETRLDDLFVIWSNGVRQHYLDVDVTNDRWVARRELRKESDPDVSFCGGNPRRFVIRQIDRRGGSCPLLFASDGQSLHFVTDVLCNAPLGLDLGGGMRAMPDPRDWVAVPAAFLKPVDGRYDLRVTEEFREVTYLDQTRLLVLDHPDDVEIFLDNGFAGPAPAAGFRPYAVRVKRPLRAAVDDRGNDVLDRLAHLDRSYVDDFDRCAPPMQGMAATHSLTLDLGDLPADGPVRLFLTGWFFWTNSSVNDALAQDGSWRFTPPRLEVGDGQGGFVPAGGVGVPAGDVKTVVTDLSALIRRDDPRVRLTTNLQIYWDRAFVSTDDDALLQDVEVRELEPSSATLRWRGYSRRYFPDGHEPHVYDYASTAESTELYGSAYFHHEGAYTRYGDVLPLLDQPDDRYAILDHGDEIALAFDAPPDPGPGRARSFAFHSVGWAKDGDHNSAEATRVEPLPFLAMSSYPYPAKEHYPEDEAHARYRAEWNTRLRTRAPMVAAPRRRAPALPEATPGHVVFTDVTDSAGIDFRHVDGRKLVNIEETMGSGVAFGDFDGDGDDDLCLVQGEGPDHGATHPGLFTTRLFRNDGRGRFTDVTARAGVGVHGSGMAALFADLDNDGDQDLVITSVGPTLLFENHGDGTFTDVTERAGVGILGYGAGVAAGDYDNDGDLDLYVGRYLTIDPDNRPQEAQGYGRGFVRDDPPSILPMTYPPAPNTLFRNDGDLRFTDVTANAGVADPDGKTLAVLFFDFDEDGWLDLFCADDVTPNNFFRNRGDGTFESLAFDVGLDDPRGAMGAQALDVDGDLDLDLAVTYWQAEPNGLYRNNVVHHQSRKSRVPSFEDVAVPLGLARASVGVVGWGIDIADFDQDLALDALVVNGYTSPDYETTDACLPQLPLFFRGTPEGTFEEAGDPRFGAILGEALNGRGLACADIDGDGDLDVAITQNNGDARLLRNDGTRGSWLQVRLRGTASPRDPAGARVDVRVGQRVLSRVLLLGSSYLSEHSKTLHFGLGAHEGYDALTVHWPSGKTSTLAGGPARRRLDLVEPP